MTERTAEPGYLIHTTGGMYRAETRARYPWTRHRDEARRYATKEEAEAQAAHHAAQIGRPLADYVIEPEGPGA